MKRTSSILTMLIVFCFAFSTSFVFAKDGEDDNSGSGSSTQQNDDDSNDDNGVDANDTDDDSGLDDAKKEWETQQGEIKTKKDKLTTEGKKKSFESAQKVVTKIIENSVEKLNKLKSKVNKTGLEADKKAELIALIDEQIATINGFKDDVQNATTKEELKAIAKQVKETLSETKDIVKNVISDVLESKIAELIEKLEKISEKLSGKIDELKAKNVDVTELEALLDEANSNLAEASNLLATNKFKEAHASTEKARTNLAKLAGLIKASEAKLDNDNN